MISRIPIYLAYQGFYFEFYFDDKSLQMVLSCRVTVILGYLPQELQGTSVYEYYHIDDIPQMADRHKEGK